MVRNRTISKFIIIFLIAGMTLSACGKEKDEEIASEAYVDTKEELPSIQTEDEGKVTEGEETVDKTVGTDSLTIYEDFLNGKNTVGISKVDLNTYMYEDLEGTIDHTKQYTIEELLETFFKDRLDTHDNCYSVDSLDYAYVDIGKDGEMELVLRFVSQIMYDSFSNIMIIKNIDGKLELCYFTEDGYRGYNYVNQDGVIATGGSGGASIWYDCYRTLDSEGNVVFLCDRESMGAHNIYFNGEDYGEIAERLNVADDILVIRYSLEEYNNEYFDEKLYDEYLNKAYYSFEIYGENGELIHPADIYDSSSNYEKFVKQISDNVYSYDDIHNIINEHLSGYNLTEKMLEDNNPNWMTWEGHDELFAATVIPPTEIVVENPSWEYYATDYPYEIGRDDFVTLNELSHESNDITDDQKWFDEIGIAMPEGGIIDEAGSMYSFKLTSRNGQYYHEYDTVTIHNNYTNRDEAILDFSNYTIPDEIAAGDEDFVRECVNYIQIVDNVVYVSIAHRTYAKSAPHNAYIVALDMNDSFKVIWKSEPLTCNSDNFAIVDGSIICGYGFTNEPDYIYELNRYTGERMSTIKVKTGPDYFYAIDGKLYVRTYDTNYVYQLAWG